MEDDELLRIVVEDLLGLAGAMVASLPDAEAAVARLEADPDVDVVLTDLHLPGRSGLWLAEWCERSIPGLPVVLTSAALPASGTVFPPPVRRYVRKPFAPRALLQALAEAVGPSGPEG